MKDPGVIHCCRVCQGNHRTRAHEKITTNGHPDGMGAMIYCACGCGANLTEMDDDKRLRRFVRGHNKREWWGRVQHLIRVGLAKER